MLRLSGYAAGILAVLLAGCTPRPSAFDYPRTATYAIAATEETPLSKALAPSVRAHPGESGFHLLTTGTDAFLMRMALVQTAKRSIDLQYFSTRDDTTGQLLLEAILQAADRGVRVRMLLDDWNLDDFKAGAAALNSHPNIEIRVFNPYSTRDQSVFSWAGNFMTRSGQWMRRMHNKALIADNQIAIMGGRNLGDEYFDAGHDINFRDVDIFAAGPVTVKISGSFDRYWNSGESFPLTALHVQESDPQTITDLRDKFRRHWQDVMHSPAGKQLHGLNLAAKISARQLPLIWAPAELVADSPGKVNIPSDEAASPPAVRIDELAQHANHEFVIIAPYFVPLDDGVRWLNSLVARGITVRILTNSLASTDMVPVEAGYSHYRAALVEGGVELYELKSLQPAPAKTMFKPSSQNGLHAKIYMIDRRDLVIGSFNFDPRSIKFNTEQVLVIHSPELSGKVARLFEHITSPALSYHLMLADHSLVWATEEDGETKHYDFTPHAGFWRSLTSGVFSMFPIDSEL